MIYKWLVTLRVPPYKLEPMPRWIGGIWPCHLSIKALIESGLTSWGCLQLDSLQAYSRGITHQPRLVRCVANVANRNGSQLARPQRLLLLVSRGAWPRSRVSHTQRTQKSLYRFTQYMLKVYRCKRLKPVAILAFCPTTCGCLITP